MKASQNCINLIKRFEGCSLTAYKCPAGVYTIGYGHTQGVKNLDKITQKEAEELLKEDIKAFETTLNVFVLPSCTLNQNEFDALVSLIFNIGILNFKRSTLLKKLMAHDKQGAAEQFDVWVYAKGVKLAGLVKRRQAEKELFLKPIET